MIKVLHYGVSDNLGGIETYLQKITKAVNHQKFQFDFIVPKEGAPEGFDELLKYNCHFYKVTSRQQNPLKNFIEINSIINENNYDIIHCHLVSLSYITPIVIARRKGIPVVIHSHSSNSPKSPVTLILHNLNKYRITKYKYKAVAVSKQASEWLFNQDKDVEILNNGIDINKYRFNDMSRTLIRNEFNLKDDFVAIHIGMFAEVKNHNYLLDIFKEINKTNPKSKLLLVGDGPTKEKQDIFSKIAKLKLENSIIYLGTRTDIPDLLSSADCLIFPSIYEGFPGVVIEAQTSGLPCLISDSITDEVVINDNCFRLPLNSDPKIWAEKALSIKNYRDRSYGAENIKEHNLSVEDEIVKIENLYLDLFDSTKKLRLG